MNTFITKPFLKTVSLVSVYSIIANVILLIISRAFAGAPATFAPFTYTPVIFLTLGGVVAAAVVYLLIKKFFKNYNKVFIIVSIIALIVSFIPDIQLVHPVDAEDFGATPLIIGILMLMHVIAAVLVIRMFTREG